LSASNHINFTLQQGATFRRTFILRDSKTTEPLDLTGCSARMQVRPTLISDDVLLELTIDNGGITITPLEGKIELHIAHDATVNTTWRKGIYQLEIVFANGDVSRYLEGTITHSLEVTR